MRLRIDTTGAVRCIHSDAIALREIGRLSVTRASHVEFDNHAGCWFADLSPVGGPLLTGFAERSEALAEESAWLDAHWLCRQ